MRRSLAAATGGFLFSGCVATSGRFDDRLMISSTMEIVFLATFTLLLAYYHRQWALGLPTAAVGVVAILAANLLWAKFLNISMIYLAATVFLSGGILLGLAHRRLAGPQPEDELEEQAVGDLMDEVDRNVTWRDRVTLLCIAASVIILVILLWR